MTEINSGALTQTVNATHDLTGSFIPEQEINLEDGALTYLPRINISVLEGFNPREFFDAKEDQELMDSIKNNGIIQPIVVFPSETNSGFYHIVAGERRFRAATKLGLDELPVLVKHIGYDEAYLLAVIENTIRADMSVGNEVKAATRVLSAADGDRDEVCKRLGWNRFKLDSRLLLSHANKSVLDAVALNSIKIGVAELLSQLPSDMQDKTLAAVIENKYTIAEIKDRLGGYVRDLSRAVFDISSCTGCPHNSSHQASLFEEHIDLGKCANQTCFANKTQEALDAKKADLAEKYNKVFLDTEKTKDSYAVIELNGVRGVGEAQYEIACKSCAHFGAILDTSPSKLGSIIEDVCFSTACLKQKIAEYQEASNAKPEKQSSTSASTTSPSGTTNQCNPANTDKPVQTGTQPVKAASKETPKKVTKNIEDFISSTAQAITLSNEHIALATCTLMAYLAAKNKIELLPDNLAAAIKQANANQRQELLITFFYRCKQDTLNQIQVNIAAYLLAIPNNENFQHEKWVESAKSILEVTQTDISQHFIVNKEFLGTFTKSGMEAMLSEAKNQAGELFIAYYEEKNGKDSFKKLMSQKNAEIITAVMDSGFDFKGFVPSVVNQQLKPKK